MLAVWLAGIVCFLGLMAFMVIIYHLNQLPISENKDIKIRILRIWDTIIDNNATFYVELENIGNVPLDGCEVYLVNNDQVCLKLEADETDWAVKSRKLWTYNILADGRYINPVAFESFIFPATNSSRVCGIRVTSDTHNTIFQEIITENFNDYLMDIKESKAFRNCEYLLNNIEDYQSLLKDPYKIKIW